MKPNLTAHHGAADPSIITFHPPLHLVGQTAALIAADLLGQPKDEDRQLVTLRLVEFLVHANVHPHCQPPTDATEVAEREHLGCAYCGTGIYASAPSTVASAVSPTKHSISPAMRRILENLAAGRPTLSHVHGRSSHGGAFGTIHALLRRGWISLNASSQWVITDEGRAALVTTAAE